MRFCNVKTEAQQDIQSLHRMRNLLIQQRTAVANQLRGILAEYGTVIPQGINHLRKNLEMVLGNNTNDMSSPILSSLLQMKKHFEHLDEMIAFYDNKIETLFNTNETCKSLEKIPGVGLLGASILAAVLGNGLAFKNGRHFAAFLGLTPRQHSSGEKEHLLGISKGGDTYIRTILTHGARSVLIWVNKKTNHPNKWLKDLYTRRGLNKAVVAMANKIARTAWAIVAKNVDYDSNYKHVINGVVVS